MKENKLRDTVTFCCEENIELRESRIGNMKKKPSKLITKLTKSCISLSLEIKKILIDTCPILDIFIILVVKYGYLNTEYICVQYTFTYFILKIEILVFKNQKQ